jgi:hypothetical protein
LDLLQVAIMELSAMLQRRCLASAQRKRGKQHEHRRSRPAASNGHSVRLPRAALALARVRLSAHYVTGFPRIDWLAV